MGEKKRLLLLVEELPSQMRSVIKAFHPTAGGFIVEEASSEHDVEQVGGQTKQDGMLITSYQQRKTGELFFRVVDTRDNWSTKWYRALALTQQTQIA